MTAKVKFKPPGRTRPSPIVLCAWRVALLGLAAVRTAAAQGDEGNHLPIPGPGFNAAQPDAATENLSRTTPPSPSLNAPPPEQAVVLFDGKNLDAWASQKPKEWETADGPADDWKLLAGECLEAVPGAGSIITRQKFGSVRLHLEFRTLGPVNSGVYLQSRYEVGLKDSFGQTEGAPCGAPGNFSGPGTDSPIKNAAAPPFQWQTLDIAFRAPRFNQDGTAKEKNARVTVALNGVQLYENVEITAVKGAAKRLGETPTGPLMLQEHGAPIQFRNIWVIEEAD